MINNFIGGGQVFLHKMRMFKQVVGSTIKISLLLAISIACIFKLPAIKTLNLSAGFTYLKANLAISFVHGMNIITDVKQPVIDAYSNGKLLISNMDASTVLKTSLFFNSYNQITRFLWDLLLLAMIFKFIGLICVAIIWIKFGKFFKEEKKIKGGEILNAKSIAKILRNIKKTGVFKIGNMPLIKDSETKHFLITGATGSGKTNLIHNFLPQVESKKQPVIVIDQTGEMISKYYNKERGDIIFNPFDERSHHWDFWGDCNDLETIERFAMILIGFNSRKSNRHALDFWEESAQSIFIDAATILQSRGEESIETLREFLCRSGNDYLATLLENSDSAKHFEKDNSKTLGSIMSVLTTNIKPLRFLKDEIDNKFSLRDHFKSLDKGSDAWLFLATKPSSRKLTLPLIACLAELALSNIRELEINSERRIWFVIDELAALGKLPALPPLMAEGRKYGACVIAGMQSLNQIYAQYGQYEGSTIFGQFGTNFFFRNNEPAIANMVSNLCGTETIYRQQKNTSYGASEIRDGQSYTEQEKSKNLVDASDLAKLSTGECFVLLPEPEVRLGKIKIPEVKMVNKNKGFIRKLPVLAQNNTEIEGDITFSTCESFEDSSENKQTKKVRKKLKKMEEKNNEKNEALPKKQKKSKNLVCEDVAPEMG